MRMKAFHLLIIGLLAILASTGCSVIDEGLKGERIASSIAEGDRQADLGNPVKARQFYDRAISLAPHSALPYIGVDPREDPESGLISALFGRSDFLTLNDYLSKAVADPKLASTWNLWLALGEVQVRLGDTADSKVSFQKALDILNGKMVVKGEVLPKSGPTGNEEDIAEAEWGTGLHPKARADYLAIIAGDPKSPDAADAENALAYQEAEASENLPEALSLAQKAVDLVRENGQTGTVLGECLDTLGWAEHKLGKDKDASSDITEALDNDPREPILHMHMADVDRALGETQAALIEVQRAYTLCPSDYEVKEAVKEIDPQLLTAQPFAS